MRTTEHRCGKCSWGGTGSTDCPNFVGREVEAGRDAWVDYGEDPEPEDFWDRLDRAWAEMKESW